MSILSNTNLANTWQILSNSTFLKNLAKSKIEATPPSDNIIEKLYQAYNYENKLAALLPLFIKELTNYSQNSAPELVNILAQSELTKNTQQQVVENFQETMVAGAKETAKYLSNSSIRTKAHTVSEVVLTGSLFLIQSTLDFKEKIDSKFPITTDQILDLAAPVIIAAIFTQSPPLAIALQISGLLNGLTKLFKTENLQKAADFCERKLNKIREDKNLSKNLFLAENLTLIGEELEVKPESLYRAGFSSDNKNPSSKENNVTTPESSSTEHKKQFAQDVVQFSEKYLFQQKSEIDDFFTELKNKAVTKLIQNNFSPEIINDFQKIFMQTNKDALLNMYDSSNVTKPLFTRIESVNKGLNLIQKHSVQYLPKLIKNHQIIAQSEQIKLGEALQTIQDELIQIRKIRNKAEQKMLVQLNKDSAVREFAVKYLGYQQHFPNNKQTNIHKVHNRKNAIYRG